MPDGYNRSINNPLAKNTYRRSKETRENGKQVIVCLPPEGYGDAWSGSGVVKR